MQLTIRLNNKCLEDLARCIIRACFPQKRMTHVPARGQGLCGSLVSENRPTWSEKSTG
jgi:hypothetical protein